jgi:hypothetical protein
MLSAENQTRVPLRLRSGQALSLCYVLRAPDRDDKAGVRCAHGLLCRAADPFRLRSGQALTWASVPSLRDSGLFSVTEPRHFRAGLLLCRPFGT